MPKTNSQLKSEYTSISPRSQICPPPPYRMSDSALPLTEPATYKNFLENKNSYSKQTTFMTYSNDIKLEPYSTNLCQAEPTNDHLQYSSYHNQLPLSNASVGSEEYKNFQDLNTFMVNIFPKAKLTA